MKRSLILKIRKIEGLARDVSKSEQDIVEDLLLGMSPENIAFLESECRKIELIEKFENVFNEQIAAGEIDDVSCPSVKLADFFDSELLYALVLEMEGEDGAAEYLASVADYLFKGVKRSDGRPVTIWESATKQPRSIK